VGIPDLVNVLPLRQHVWTFNITAQPLTIDVDARRRDDESTPACLPLAATPAPA